MSKKRSLTLKNKHKTVLNQLLDLKIDANYSCMIGVCGACVCKKPIKGDFKYIDDVLPMIQDNEYLPCIAVPDNEVTIEIDEDKISHLINK